MRILLCQAPNAHRRLGRLPPLSLLYLAAAARECGHYVELLDLDLAGSVEPLLDALEHGYDVLGVTSCTENYHLAQLTCSMAKSRDPGLRIVYGGPHATPLAEEVLAETPEVDVVVRGEGELTLCALLEAWEQGKPLHEVPQIAYRSGERTLETGERATPPPLDDLPLPAWDLVDLHQYTTSCCVTARGCPHTCNFCAGRAVTNKYRARTPENVGREIQILASITPPDKDLDIEFFDNTFHADGPWLEHFLEQMNSLPRKLYWTAELRCDQVRPDLPGKLQGAGCRVVRVGAESGSDEVLGRIGKGTTARQSEWAVEACLEAGLVTFATFCIGHPDDTPATIGETVALMRRLSNVGAYVAASIVTPFPGTDLYRSPSTWGIEILSRDWRRYNLYTPVMNTRYLSATDIGHLFMEQVVANGFYGAVPKWGTAGREVVKGLAIGGE